MAISSISNQTTPVEQTKPSYSTADMKKESDKRIVEAQLEVSLKDGPSVMSLLFRTAIEEINKHMPTGSKESTIEKAYENNIDVSPQATAKRIISGATAFFNAYKEQNSELTETEALNQFMGVIRSGIDTGFGEARNILDGLSVLEDELASEIDATYDFVQTGLNEFSEKLTAKIEEENTEQSDQI
ncbi:DUF5610 domain-containing protein [Pseudocolwellia sp. HL-MZ19]|uniref:DUF5610 domain-containing protein n=1 Tax=Pseudocolwellia sp. HL-MZ19 TaxID=3400846 RepID=UPI003CED194B